MEGISRFVPFGRIGLASLGILALVVLTLASRTNGASAAGTNVGCVVNSTMTTSAVCQKRLSDAQRRWPDAPVSPSGRGNGFGRFIIPSANGDDFQLLTVAGSVKPGLLPPDQAQVAQSATRAHSVSVGTDQALLAGIAGKCGNYYTVVVNPSTTQWLTTVEYDTTNYVQLCYQAWTPWVQPKCWGGGQCQPAQYGVIGQHSWQTNPWDNQTVYMWNCCTVQYYLRVWVDRYGNVGWYAGH